MGLFRYVAYDKAGKIEKGLLEADSARKIRDILQKKGLSPTAITPTTEKTAGSLWTFRKTVPVVELAAMTRELSILLESGLPLEQALQATAEQTENKNLNEIMLRIRDRVREGYPLSKGMTDFPDVFSPIYQATIYAGEQSGRLEVVLAHLADYTENQYRMRQRIVQALVYPSLMTLVSFGIVVFLLTAVVPNMVDMFRDSKAQLPTLTVIMVTISDFLSQYGIYLLAALVILGLFCKRMLRRASVKARLQSVLLRLPLIGKSLKTVNTARYCRTLGILSKAGVPIVAAMNSAAEVVTVFAIQDALRGAAVKVREGTVISTALKKTGYFLPMTIHFIVNGEKAGELEQMLQRAADNQDQKMTMLIETGLTIFEPLLILVMGAVVLFIVMATLLPLFEITQLL